MHIDAFGLSLHGFIGCLNDISTFIMEVVLVGEMLKNGTIIIQLDSLIMMI